MSNEARERIERQLDEWGDNKLIPVAVDDLRRVLHDASIAITLLEWALDQQENNRIIGAIDTSTGQFVLYKTEGIMTSLADELETAIKAVRPNATLLPHPSANPPDHRMIDIAWSRFYITVLAPSTNAGIVQGYLLFTDLQATPEVFTDVAPLLERIKALVPE